MRFSSSFKVGILTLTALIIFVFGVLWIKGRALSAGERLSVDFKDVNGLRAGSGVQMMGLRVGQVEEIIPKIDAENSAIKVKFVITEPGIAIPTASEISIQQSGIIGEQFLEITPPRTRHIYIPINTKSEVLHSEDEIEMMLSKKYYNVGKIKKLEIVDSSTLPLSIKTNIKTQYAYKISFVITLPGLIVPDRLEGRIITKGDDNILRLVPLSGMMLPYPQSSSKYTVIEPMRISDFMNLQYEAANSLKQTNEKLNTLLSDDVIAELKDTAKNINKLTMKATTTIEKAEMLVDSSKDEISILIANLNTTSVKVNTLTDNLNAIAGDVDFQKDIKATTKSINRLSSNINKVLEDKNTQETISNLHMASRNIAEISAYVNDITKDQKLKADLSQTVVKFNKALDQLNVTLETVNAVSATPEERAKIKETLQEAHATSKNLKKFSEKLNKRFLLFRLMF